MSRNRLNSNENATSTEPQIRSQEPQMPRNRLNSNENTTSMEPQIPSQEFQMIQIAFRNNHNDLRLHLKRTSKPSQEPQMVQNAFKIQSTLFEVAPQTHLKAISRTSNGAACIRKTSKTV